MPWIKILVASTAVVLMYLYQHVVPTNKLTDIYVLEASLSATLLGFVFTALSILIAVPSATLITKLKASDHYDLLTREMLMATAVLFMGMLLGMVAVLAPDVCHQYSLPLITGVFVLSMQYFASVGYKFYLVMEYLGKQH